MQTRFIALFFLGLIQNACDAPIEISDPSQEAIADPAAKDFFFMHNPEIRNDLLEQLSIHNIEYWINEDQSIGFYVKDTREVDRLANEAIGVYISAQ